MIVYENGEQFNVPSKWLAEHDKQIMNEAIEEFAHELKETFNQETPSNMSCYEKYFALDDCRMWIDIIANIMKGEQNEEHNS